MKVATAQSRKNCIYIYIYSSFIRISVVRSRLVTVYVKALFVLCL